jgi:hypothetical protein
MAVTSLSASGVAREPFYRRARSPEREHIATEWPCGGALSGSWSGHALASATSGGKRWWPLGVHGNGCSIHGTP